MISPMATHLTYSHFFLPSHKLFVVSPQPCLCKFRRLHDRSFLAVVCASSPNKTSVAGRKQAKSNADLCNDLRGFMAEIGIPDEDVPSLKELSQHASQKISVSDCDVESNVTEDKASNEDDESTGINENEKELAEDVLLLCEDTIIEETSKTKNFDNDTASNVESFFLVDGSTKSLLQEKVAKFIQSGELEAIEDDDFEVVNAMENSGSQNSTGPELSSVSEEPNGQVHYVSDSVNLANGSVLTSQPVNSTSQFSTSNNQLASEEFSNTDMDVEIRTLEDQAEINRIKVMLHHKELNCPS